MKYRSDKDFAAEMDNRDPLREYRSRFLFPLQENGEEKIYFCGNSLGLQPKSAREYVEQVMKDWAILAVEGHFRGENPWMRYQDTIAGQTARLIGANPAEVVIMNALTVNLHLMLVSFYRPAALRYKILIEANAFPSDQYAVKSQLRFHGYDPADALIELPLREGEVIHRSDDIEELIEKKGESIALIILGGINYYTGQVFDMEHITRAGHSKGCMVGFDLAHAVGNVEMELHNWSVDFAVWCSYKYLNGGPGAPAGCFVHERHNNKDTPRFAGWWGHDKETRFLMGPDFVPIRGAEGWQISNPSILPLAPLRAATDIFHETGMEKLIQKSRLLTGYLEFLVDQIGAEKITIITPREKKRRGCQLSLVVKNNGKAVFQELIESGVVCDWREPDVIRVAPAPLYNSFTDVFRFAEMLKKFV
jgi:kynureninase